MPFAIFGHLLERRVPQIVGIYLGASWVMVEFITLLVDRFALSPHLIELSMVVLAMLIPTVVLMGYCHGMPGRQEWTAAEKIGVPVNLLLVAAVVFFLFADRPLGAATRTVTVETEAGETLERVIPRSEFRKRVLLLGFENRSGDAALDWMQLGLRIALLLDLDQDAFLEVESQDRLQVGLERVGYPEAVGLDVQLMARLARELRQDHFVFGWFTEQDGELAVSVSLYETRRQRQVAERTFVGSDALRLVDQMSVELRRELGVPERHIDDTADLPVSVIISESVEAFEHISRAIDEMIRSNDWAAARDHLERSVAVDPASVLALYELALAYLVLNEREKADSLSQLALRYLYKLPESWQYEVQYFYYSNIEPDADRRMRIAETMVRLFPDDLNGHVMLAREYILRDQTDEVIAEYERILEIDPSQHEYIREIGAVYRGRGELERALEYYDRYAEIAPDDYSAYRHLGAVYAAMGEHERSRSYFEQALVIDPDNASLMSDLAIARFNLGDFEGAERGFEEALESATAPADRAAAHSRLSDHYRLLGQLAKAIEHEELEWSEWERSHPASVVFTDVKLPSLGLFAMAGQQQRAFEILRRAEDELRVPFNRTIPLGYLNVYLELEDADNAERALAEVEAWVESQQEEHRRDLVLNALGRIQEIRGAYEEAVDSYRRSLELAPANTYTKRRIARCYRELGRLDEAEAYLKEHLVSTPNNPHAHFELARVYANRDERMLALQHLRTALEVWSDADPTFEPARQARVMLAELGPA